MAEAQEKSFEEIASRLDEIVDTVRAKDTSLEHSLDLFDEAIKLGNAAVEMVDNIDFDSEDADAEPGAEAPEEAPAAAPDETPASE